MAARVVVWVVAGLVAVVFTTYGEPEIGTTYRTRFVSDCDVPFVIGNTVWKFVGAPVDWPPMESRGWYEDNWGSIGSSYFVPGILTRRSANEALFRADVNGAEMELVRGSLDDLDHAVCL